MKNQVIKNKKKVKIQSNKKIDYYNETIKKYKPEDKDKEIVKEKEREKEKEKEKEKEEVEIEKEIFKCSIETKFNSVINNNNGDSNKSSFNKKEKISNRVQNLNNLIHFSNITSKKINNNNKEKDISSKNN